MRATFGSLRTVRQPMSSESKRRSQSTSRVRPRALALAAVLVTIGAFPGAAVAHGPIAPVASSYLAKVSRVPAGVDAKVADGDQRMWLRVVASETVEVLDYRGAPYLRFSASGVAVNQNSAMYYLNQTPVAAVPPSNLTRTTPSKWQPVTTGHGYVWHDGRLHALAAVALSPGVAYVGTWSIPLVVDGRQASVSGGLWHAKNPSIVWFWPIVVVLLCVLAAWRARRPRLDRLAARGVAVAALAAIAVAALGQGLYGRPTVSILQLIELGAVLAFAAWRLFRLVSARVRPGYFSYFAIAFVALWEGAALIPTLLSGFVLMAVPAFVARAATVLCLGCGLALLLLAPRIGEQEEASSTRRRKVGSGELRA
jgi:hypothetical protein